MLFKIFLTFWLTLALLAAGQEIVSMLAQKDEQAALADARVLVAEAQSVVDAYDRGGAVAAREVAGRFEKERGAGADLLDDNHRSLLGNEVRPAVLATARLAQRAAAQGSKLAIVNIGEHAAAKQVASPSGARLMLIVDLPRHGTARAASGWALSPIARYSAVIVVGGLLCFALARHISRPLVKLAGAANALADGRLHTRVGSRITRRHDEVGRLARDFDRMAERIEALVAGQRRLLGDVSHELRSPLARLTVAGGLARRSAPAESAEYFDRIDTETTRLDRLIEQLLTLARIESTVDDELRGEVNFTELVQEVVSDGDFEARASGKRVTLVAGGETVLHGRADLLRSAVENIVRNAIRYTRPGTAVEVRLERSEQSQSSKHVMLTVRDHGPGVPDTKVADIFRRFWRASGSPTESPDGAGLGLAIADSVIRVHGGTIGAANEGQGGLLVTIELPIG
jgi:two-component system sensor histidine kinase CpxA